MSATSMTEELRAFFGAPKDTGALVQRVLPDTPAAKAGVKVGDVITRVDGQPVDAPSDISSAISQKQSGELVTLAVVRAKRQLQLTAKLDTDSDDGGFDFELDLDDPLSVFRQLGPGQKSWFKSWSWQWPPAGTGGSASGQSNSPKGPSVKRFDQRLRELERRFDRLEKQRH